MANMMYNRIFLYRRLFKRFNSHSMKTIKPKFKLVNNLNSLSCFENFHLEKNKLAFSRLKNGMKVMTLDNNRRITSLALLIRMGGRLDSHKYSGASRLLHNLAINLGGKYTENLNLIDKLYLNGIILNSNYNREFTSFLIEYLRGENIDYISGFLDDIFQIYRTDIDDGEIEKSKKELLDELKFESKNIDFVIDELLHSTAWNNDILGNEQLVSYEKLLDIDKKNLISFRDKYFAPENTIIIGSGIQHKDLLSKVIESSNKCNILHNYSKNSLRKRPKIRSNKYTGGIKILKTKNYMFTNILIAFETNLEWKSYDLISLLVLQSYLGGGSSFSVGGPGKGMHTKLFLEVLSKLDWVENCNCFINQYSNSGIFGIQITSFPGFALESIKTIASQFGEMKNINEIELRRAKNMVRSNISMMYEDKNLYIEDIAKNILSYSEYITLEELFKCIENITVEDIRRVSSLVISGVEKPTIIAVGIDVDKLPNYEEIVALLKTMIDRN